MTKEHSSTNEAAPVANSPAAPPRSKITVDRLATILAGNAPKAMAGMKRAINEFARGKLDEAAADRRHRESMRGAEIREGPKARAEKPPPKF